MSHSYILTASVTDVVLLQLERLQQPYYYSTRAVKQHSGAVHHYVVMLVYMQVSGWWSGGVFSVRFSLQLLLL